MQKSTQKYVHLPNRKPVVKAIAVAAGVMLAPNAFAYLDPGTGSIIIQGLIAGIAMVGVTARMYWHKLQSMFGTGRAAEDKTALTVEQASEAEEEAPTTK